MRTKESEHKIRYKEFILTPDDLNITLNSERRIKFIDAPGEGKSIQLLNASIGMVFNSVPYNTDIVNGWLGKIGGQALFTSEFGNLLGREDSDFIITMSAPPDIASEGGDGIGKNQAVYFSVADDASISEGDSQVVIKVSYIIHDMEI